MTRDHNSEIALLGLMAFGVIVILVIVVMKGVTGWDVAACLLVLQSIISAIKERWTQRSVDRLGDQMGATANQTAATSAALAQTVASAAPVAAATDPTLKTDQMKVQADSVEVKPGPGENR